MDKHIDRAAGVRVKHSDKVRRREVAAILARGVVRHLKNQRPGEAEHGHEKRLEKTSPHGRHRP